MLINMKMLPILYRLSNSHSSYALVYFHDSIQKLAAVHLVRRDQFFVLDYPLQETQLYNRVTLSSVR